MTMTVKLDAEMEQQIRQRSAALGKPASTLIRQAISEWLQNTQALESSAFDLGKDLFGKHEGPSDLAEKRKGYFADVLEEKIDKGER